MSEINTNKIVGDAFEELTIAEMTQVQGVGDVEARFTTPVCAFSVSFMATAQLVSVLKTCWLLKNDGGGF